MNTKNKVVSDMFNIPYNTVRDWEKSKTYRGGLLKKLSEYCFLEKEAEHFINTLFTEEEREVLSSAFQNLEISEKYLEGERLTIIFKDYCAYNDIDNNANINISRKLNSLKMFERYVLLKLSKASGR